MFSILSFIKIVKSNKRSQFYSDDIIIWYKTKSIYLYVREMFNHLLYSEQINLRLNNEYVKTINIHPYVSIFVTPVRNHLISLLTGNAVLPKNNGFKNWILKVGKMMLHLKPFTFFLFLFFGRHGVKNHSVFVWTYKLDWVAFFGNQEFVNKYICNVSFCILNLQPYFQIFKHFLIDSNEMKKRELAT